MNYIVSLNDELVAQIHERAAIEQKSVTEVMLVALYRGLDLFPASELPTNLSEIFSSVPLEPEVIEALEDQRKT